MKFAVYQASKIGGRKYNQDRVGYAYTSEVLLLVLADGMGGHLHGEVAAQIAVLTFMRAFGRLKEGLVKEPEVFLRETMRAGHDAIFEYAREQQLGGNPGTTCVVALVQGGHIWWAHAGDSRCYLLRDGKVAGVTHDHSVVQQWADWGIIGADEMRTHPDRNKITNCLGGVEDMFYVDVSEPSAVQSGDTLLLCSDGFWSPLEDNEIADLAGASVLADRVDELIEMAVKRDSIRADNTTAVAARLGEREEEHLAEMPMCIVLDERPVPKDF
ncbi:MAG: protein phosphatase 2C domain-containing protein [Gammaproteobacteria bacterium]|nr:protein phosphatase 2C domain-containing protein [Gammaproteobacteria bacterium]MBU1776288.1 protein phosphatase 2C domain-containing protein [Gammaproteobacteria bacterium]MBU1967977.1 protein phosphatase 2C domain-containing protein [Gammaproteobacteria bacterium]